MEDSGPENASTDKNKGRKDVHLKDWYLTKLQGTTTQKTVFI